MSSYLNHTELHMKGCWLRDHKRVGCWGGLHLLAPQFSQPVFANQGLALKFTSLPCPFFFFLQILFWFLARVILRIFFSNSQDPVYLLTSNYSCAELLKNEMSTHQQIGCPLTRMLSGYFASSQLFIKLQLFRLLTEEHFDVSGYVIILACLIRCWVVTCSNLADALCQIQRSRQL